VLCCVVVGSWCSRLFGVTVFLSFLLLGCAPGVRLLLICWYYYMRMPGRMSIFQKPKSFNAVCDGDGCDCDHPQCNPFFVNNSSRQLAPSSAASEFAGGFRAYQFMRLCSPRFFRSDVSELLASSVPELVLDHSSSDIHHTPTKWRDIHFPSTPPTSLRLSVYTTLTSSLFLTPPHSKQHGHRC
jgi:hypothetical protein